MRYISETVQHQKYNGMTVDPRGNEVESWAAATNLGIYAMSPGTTGDEFVPGHDRVVTLPAIYAPAGTSVGPHDRITARGILYEVDGVMREWRNPYGAEMNGVQIDLKEVMG